MKGGSLPHIYRTSPSMYFSNGGLLSIVYIALSSVVRLNADGVKGIKLKEVVSRSIVRQFMPHNIKKIIKQFQNPNSKSQSIQSTLPERGKREMYFKVSSDLLLR